MHAGRRWWMLLVALVVGAAIVLAAQGRRTPAPALADASPARPADQAVAVGTAPLPTATLPSTIPPAEAPIDRSPDGAGPAEVPPTTMVPTRRATIAVSGDIITHQAVGRVAAAYARDSNLEFDFGPMFADVAPTLSAADLALCHLESPLAEGGTFQPFPRFNGPAELAVALAAAGFDGCSLASNHSFDQGSSGVAATIAAMRSAGLGHTGTAARSEDAGRVARYSAGGIEIAHLSYTYGVNGFEPDPWEVRLIDPAVVAADALLARAAGAEFVVASMHWGNEYQRSPSSLQVQWATDIAPAVDLVVGHHAHVIQPVDVIGDTLVLYGLGNFLSNQEPTCCTAYSQDGVIVTVEIGDGPDGVSVLGYTITPTMVDRPTMRIIPVVSTLARLDASSERWLQSRLDASLRRTVDSLGLLGSPVPTPR